MEADEYRKLAAVEDRMWYFRSLHGHVRRELERAFTDTGFTSPRILDAGCGTGGLIRRLRGVHPDWKYEGVDVMPQACELARASCGPEIPIAEGSVTALPYADASFDAVTSADVIYQLERPVEALVEFHRVLKPGGVAIVNVPAYRWLWSYHDVAVHSRHRFTRGEMDQLLARAGFGARWLTHCNALPFPLVVVKRKLLASSRDTSDVKLYPPPIEAAFNAAMAIEHGWLRLGGRWAWGSSVLAVARKP
jgi:SAM-dependent methyltransferase